MKEVFVVDDYYVVEQGGDEGWKHSLEKIMSESKWQYQFRLISTFIIRIITIFTSLVCVKSTLLLLHRTSKLGQIVYYLGQPPILCLWAKLKWDPSFNKRLLYIFVHRQKRKQQKTCCMLHIAEFIWKKK